MAQRRVRSQVWPKYLPSPEDKTAAGKHETPVVLHNNDREAY